MLHVPRPQRPLPPLVREPHNLVWNWERFGLIAGEFPPLFKRHWREIALNQDKVPLEPDWNGYLKLDVSGILRVLTVRANGLLVGYHFVLVFPHLHYASTLWAQSDMFWLDPAYRTGWTGYRLLKLVRDTLKENGVKVHAINIKLHVEAERGTLGVLFKRLGYKPVETVFSQFLG